MNFEIFQSGKSFTVFLSFIIISPCCSWRGYGLGLYFLFMDRDESLSSLSKQFPHDFQKRKKRKK